MDMRQIKDQPGVPHALVGGDHAADPLLAGDADVMLDHWRLLAGAAEDCPILLGLASILLAAAYSLGARHVLEQVQQSPEPVKRHDHEQASLAATALGLPAGMLYTVRGDDGRVLSRWHMADDGTRTELPITHEEDSK